MARRWTDGWTDLSFSRFHVPRWNPLLWGYHSLLNKDQDFPEGGAGGERIPWPWALPTVLTAWTPRSLALMGPGARLCLHFKQITVSLTEGFGVRSESLCAMLKRRQGHQTRLTGVRRAPVSGRGSRWKGTQCRSLTWFLHRKAGSTCASRWRRLTTAENQWDQAWKLPGESQRAWNTLSFVVNAKLAGGANPSLI